MGYHNDISLIDKNISDWCKASLKADPKTVYLIRHSKRSDLLAPMKPIMWREGHTHPSYITAEGGKAWKASIDLGYTLEPEVCAVSERNQFHKQLKKLGLSSNRSYRIARYVSGQAIVDSFQKYLLAEAALRVTMGRPNSRVDPLRAFGEFLYCKLFKAIQNIKQNTKGYDAIDNKQQRVSIKTARKSVTNSAGLEVRLTRSFDVLAVFWMTPDGKIAEYIACNRAELRSIYHKVREGKKFDLHPRDFMNSEGGKQILNRSQRQLSRALKHEGMIEILQLRE